MAKIYHERIKAGIMTLQEVPARWQAKVKALLEVDETDGIG